VIDAKGPVGYRYSERAFFFATQESTGIWIYALIVASPEKAIRMV
jgi:hypothetical protein